MASDVTPRPDVTDWGIVGENTALRRVYTDDPVDLQRYWVTNESVGEGLMVDDIETMEELVENARANGPGMGYTLAISGIHGKETGEFQGFVQFTPDWDDEFRNKIEGTGLFHFSDNVAIWEVSYAKYPPAAAHQVASAVRQACVLLLKYLGPEGFFPRLVIVGATEVDINPESIRVLHGACFDPIGSIHEEPRGLIQYDDISTGLDSVWLLNWNTLHHRLRQRANAQLEQKYKAV